MLRTRQYLLVAFLSIAVFNGCKGETTSTPPKPSSNADPAAKADANNPTTLGTDGDPAKKTLDMPELGGDKDKVEVAPMPAEVPQEESVVPYESKTHGALQVLTIRENPSEWYSVSRNGNNAIPSAPPLLNSTVALVPGEYLVNVNHTLRKVIITLGKKTILWTGEVVVEGGRGSGDFYAPFQGKEKKLTSAEALVNHPTSLFAGKYTVMLWEFPGSKTFDAEVKAGKRTVIKR
jgi:hypothetical protein